MLSLVQARSQKFAMRRGCLGGLGTEPPAAGDLMGSGGQAQIQLDWRHGGLGAEPLALNNFEFFCKNNLILGLS